MYSILLTLHSAIRWLVLASLVYALITAFRGWHSDKPFSKRDNLIRHATATVAHVQLIVGLWLYSISPIVNYFIHSYSEAVHNRGVRFFGMEHSLMMIIAITVLTIGSVVAKRKKSDRQKFKTMAIWFSVALIIILVSIPWPFSPFTARPYFRFF
jgi:hypothetical protein